jgi:hypothetical protein
MKTYEADPDELVFIEVVPGAKKTEPILCIRHRNENIGRHRADPWICFGTWRIVSNEELMREYPKGISHEGIPR